MERLPLLRLIGQVAATYLIAEGPDGLYLIDQHAAHERVLFDQLMAQYHAAVVPTQALVQPLAVEFPAEKALTLAQQLPALRKLGFEVEDFGPNAFLVRSVPAVFAGVTRKRCSRLWWKTLRRMKNLWLLKLKRKSLAGFANVWR